MTIVRVPYQTKGRPAGVAFNVVDSSGDILSTKRRRCAAQRYITRWNRRSKPQPPPIDEGSDQ